ncbi:hypothetical protein TNCV_3932881 [Trichonephila clavipes]|nr:hypothetical protein TNCV_3932881 [Trichonephila clavipes]
MIPWALKRETLDHICGIMVLNGLISRKVRRILKSGTKHHRRCEYTQNTCDRHEQTKTTIKGRTKTQLKISSASTKELFREIWLEEITWITSHYNWTPFFPDRTSGREVVDAGTIDGGGYWECWEKSAAGFRPWKTADRWYCEPMSKCLVTKNHGAFLDTPSNSV